MNVKNLAEILEFTDKKIQIVASRPLVKVAWEILNYNQR